jgi:outer membrane protein OmpA-like peptidoglycan-associated protein
MKPINSAAALALAIALGACATTNPQTGERDVNKTATGALIGAGVGAVLGTAAGGNDTRNAAVGAAVGAIAGTAVGAYMDEQERKLKERMAGTGVGVVRTAPNEITLSMPSDITFDVDRAEVKPQFRSTLESVATTLRDYPSTTIDVFGHADATGSDQYNMALSQRRAEAVASYLIDRGVIRERVIAQGRGETQPIADNTTADGRAKNRRVEVKVRPVTQTS